jgi:riboflavin biosynthesis pyrimidine reductase
VWAFVAPLIIGGRNAPGPVGGLGIEALAQAIRVRRLQVEMIGSNSSDGSSAPQAIKDLWIQANVEYSEEDQCLQES